MAVQQALQNLVSPLRYACEREFARLQQVRDLGALLRAALSAVEGQGLDARGLAALRAEIADVDHPSPEVRKASLRRVASALRDLGVTLPPEVALVAEGAEPRPPQADFVDAAEPEPSSSTRTSRRGAKSGKTAAPEARAEARLLSIAPRAGPLATALRSAGWRINPRLLSALERKGVQK
ncbi:MAG TPA: DNA helicase RecG, partial [Myxococcaceae bacterium]|nr:DNA helicase RecG [Myxococcaceae bacterium]